jgi:hypothetical protein
LAGFLPTSLQPGPGRTSSRTESSYERGQIGGNVRFSASSSGTPSRAKKDRARHRAGPPQRPDPA